MMKYLIIILWYFKILIRTIISFVIPIIFLVIKIVKRHSRLIVFMGILALIVNTSWESQDNKIIRQTVQEKLSCPSDDIGSILTCLQNFKSSSSSIPEISGTKNPIQNTIGQHGFHFSIDVH